MFILVNVYKFLTKNCGEAQLTVLPNGLISSSILALGLRTGLELESI
jgi:hypothetical protein